MNFLDGFFKNTLIKFHENPLRGSQVVPCTQTHMMKVIVAFRNFVNMSKNLENLGPVSIHPQVRSTLLSINFFKIHNCRWHYVETVYIRSHIS